MSEKRQTSFLRQWLFTAVGVLAATQLVDGIRADGWQALLITALLLGIFNAFLKPVLFLLTLPLQLLTLGLFSLVINAVLLLLADTLVRDFHVAGFWPAFFGGLAISVISGFLNFVFGRNQPATVNVKTSNPSPPPNHANPPPGKGPIIDV